MSRNLRFITRKWKLSVLLAMVYVVTMSTNVQGQTAAIRPIDSLLQHAEEGAARFYALVKTATNPIEVLPLDERRARPVLYATQVSARSTMGAVVYNTGGILVDSGWIRILGSGSAKLKRDLATWNTGKTTKGLGDAPMLYYIADDVTGGIFALNGGALGNDPGNVYYLPPDDLKWMAMEMGYTDFLNFCFSGNISGFYKELRWAHCQEEARATSGDEVLKFFPPLWSAESKGIDAAAKSRVPVSEYYDYLFAIMSSMNTDDMK